jgi:hypothetical protein
MQQNAGPDRAMLVAVKLTNGKGRSIRSCEDADPGTPKPSLGAPTPSPWLGV